MRDQAREDIQHFEVTQDWPDTWNNSPHTRTWATRRILDPDKKFVSESFRDEPDIPESDIIIPRDYWLVEEPDENS